MCACHQSKSQQDYERSLIGLLENLIRDETQELRFNLRHSSHVPSTLHSDCNEIKANATMWKIEKEEEKKIKEKIKENKEGKKKRERKP